MPRITEPVTEPRFKRFIALIHFCGISTPNRNEFKPPT